MGYQIITIEREFASGGSQIGQLLSDRLGIPVYGREILEKAAEKWHVTPEHIEHLEESSTNSLLYSLVAMGRSSTGQPTGLSSSDALSLTEASIIRELAAEGKCIFVGRCAGWVLRERKDTLRVFIRADEEHRLERAISQYQLPPEIAKKTMRQIDRRRANFYHANTGLLWQERSGYHMVLDSGLLGPGLCAQIIGCAAGHGKLL